MKKIIGIAISVLPLLGWVNAHAENKIFGELGMNFGSSKVGVQYTNNADGPNYYVGGGAVMGIGVQGSLNEKLDLKGLAAYRFQGGAVTNSGIVVEGSGLYKLNQKLSAGGGIHVDVSNSMEDSYGNTITFETSFAPMMVMDWKVRPNMSVGGKYIMADYQTTTGDNYDGGISNLYLNFNGF